MGKATRRDSATGSVEWLTGQLPPSLRDLDRWLYVSPEGGGLTGRRDLWAETRDYLTKLVGPVDAEVVNAVVEAATGSVEVWIKSLWARGEGQSLRLVPPAS